MLSGLLSLFFEVLLLNPGPKCCLKRHLSLNLSNCLLEALGFECDWRVIILVMAKDQRSLVEAHKNGRSLTPPMVSCFDLLMIGPTSHADTTEASANSFQMCLRPGLHKKDGRILRRPSYG